MADTTRNNPFLQLSAPAGLDRLMPIGIRGREALSEPFRFEVDLVAPLSAPPAFEALIGEPLAVSVQLVDRSTRWFHGIVERLAEGEPDGDFVPLQATLVPQWWRQAKNVRCRIFQHQTVPEILKSVLAEQTVDYHLRGTHARRNYCVQFLESDFAFASRLMEEEGIFYYFVHGESEHRLVLADHSLDCPEVAGKTLNFDRSPRGTRAECRVTAWKKTQVLSSAKHTVRDYCFELPGQRLESSTAAPERIQVGQVSHDLRAGRHDDMEVFSYPDGSAHHHDGGDGAGKEQSVDMSSLFDASRRKAKLWMEREAVHSLDIEGGGDCGHFSPGHRFALARHGKGDGDYVLTHVHHEARLSGYHSGQQPTFDYHDDFRCIPRELPFRPSLRTPRPTIPGVQTATVVGIPGEEVHTDKYGRVKVQFHWDRDGKHDADSSCWVRVGQSAAGAGFGALHIPRVGQEVLVAFHMGDPDVPYVLGSVYNGNCMPPFELPNERTRSGFKSHSHGGDGASFSGIAFDDTKDREVLQVHSQKNLALSAEADHKLAVGKNRRADVSGNDALNVGGNSTVKVGGMHSVTVGAVSIGANDLDFVKSTPWHFEAGPVAAAAGIKTEKVLGANSTLTAGVYDRVTVGLDSRIALLGDLHVVTGVGMDTVIGKRVEVTAGAASVSTTGDHTERTGGEHSLSVIGDMKIGCQNGGWKARGRLDLKSSQAIAINCSGASTLTMDAMDNGFGAVEGELDAKAYNVRFLSADAVTGESALLALKMGSLITIQVGNDPDSHKIEVSENGVHLVHDLNNYIIIDRKGVTIKALKTVIESETTTEVQGLVHKDKSVNIIDD